MHDDTVKRIVLEVKRPSGSFPGETFEAWYCIVEGSVVLTDSAGKPIGEEKRPILPNEDPRLIACAMARQQHRRNPRSPRGFNRKISYPPTGWA